MTDAELIIAVRAECGKVTNTKELEDTDLTREGIWIISAIAEKLPVKKLRSFVSEAYEREYAAHANTTRVQRVIQPGVIDRALLDLGDPIVVAGEFSSNEYYNFPSLWAIDNMRRKRGLAKLHFSWNPVHKKIVIDPAPTEAGLTYWYYSNENGEWTLANIPADFEMLLITGTSWRSLDIIALARSSLGGIHQQGGFVNYPMAELHRIASDKKDDFYRSLDVKNKLYAR